MSTTPEALRLAVLLENPPCWESQPQVVEGWASDSPLWDAAAELRRLAAVEAERDQLRAEVEALRRGEFICGKCGLRKDADAGPVPF